MKNLIKYLKKDSVGLWSFWICVFLFTIDFLTTGLLYRSLPPYLPLYNHMPWGYERIGNTIQIIIPLLFPFCLFIGNIFYATSIHEKNILLSRFLFITNICLALFTTIFLARLLQVIL